MATSVASRGVLLPGCCRARLSREQHANDRLPRVVFECPISVECSRYFHLMPILTFYCLLVLVGSAAAQSSSQLPCGGSVTNVALNVDNRVPYAAADVVISFTTQTALAAYNTVTLTYPQNFFVSGPPAGATTSSEISIKQATPGAAPQKFAAFFDTSSCCTSFFVFSVHSIHVPFNRSICHLLPPNHPQFTEQHGHHRWCLRRTPWFLLSYSKWRHHGCCNPGRPRRNHRLDHNRFAQRACTFGSHWRNSSSDLRCIFLRCDLLGHFLLQNVNMLIAKSDRIPLAAGVSVTFSFTTQVLASMFHRINAASSFDFSQTLLRGGSSSRQTVTIFHDCEAPLQPPAILLHSLTHIPSLFWIR